MLLFWECYNLFSLQRFSHWFSLNLIAKWVILLWIWGSMQKKWRKNKKNSTIWTGGKEQIMNWKILQQCDTSNHFKNFVNKIVCVLSLNDIEWEQWTCWFTMLTMVLVHCFFRFERCWWTRKNEQFGDVNLSIVENRECLNLQLEMKLSFNEFWILFQRNTKFQRKWSIYTLFFNFRRKRIIF